MTEAAETNGHGHDPLDPLKQRVEEGPKGGALTWYDVLEIPIEASASDVKKAYDRALALVEGRNIGGYLMLDPLAAESARADVEAAYQVLGDADRRSSYDARLREQGKVPAVTRADQTIPVRPAVDESEEAREAKELLSVAEAQSPRSSPSMTPTGESKIPAPTPTSSGLKFLAPVDNPSRSSDPLEAKPTMPSIHFADPKTEDAPQPAVEEVSDVFQTMKPKLAEAPAPVSTPATFVASELPEGEIPGTIIKELREKRGLTVEQLADMTKIRRPYLKAIEEQDFANLPARVYLRGFLTQVARVLKVDRARLADGYLQFVEKNAPKG
jgi:hypothetical protein